MECIHDSAPLRLMELKSFYDLVTFVAHESPIHVCGDTGINKPTEVIEVSNTRDYSSMSYHLGFVSTH